VIVYASTSQLGEIELTPAGDVYEVKIGSEEIARKSRGVGGVRESKSRPVQKKKLVSEFSETDTFIRTRR